MHPGISFSCRFNTAQSNFVQYHFTDFLIVHFTKGNRLARWKDNDMDPWAKDEQGKTSSWMC